MSQSKKLKELLNECLSFISFIQYQETQGDKLITETVKELASAFKSNLDRYPNPDFWLTQSSWERLSRKLNLSPYESKIDSINKKIHEVRQSKYPNNKSRVYTPEKPLSELTAKELLNKRRYNQFYDNDGGEEESSNQEVIQKVLKTKEHVLKPSQSRLIRKMSIHAGKKLSLQEAQSLNNKLKKKEQ